MAVKVDQCCTVFVQPHVVNIAVFVRLWMGHIL